MNPTVPLNSGSDTGFRASPAADANRKSTFLGTAVESFSAALERVVGAPAKGPGGKKPKNVAMEKPQPQNAERARAIEDESSSGVRRAFDPVLITDCPISLAALRTPEQAGQGGSRHSGDNQLAEEGSCTAAEESGKGAPALAVSDVARPGDSAVSSQGSDGDRTALLTFAQPAASRAEPALPTPAPNSNGERVDDRSSSELAPENEPSPGKLPGRAEASEVSTPLLAGDPQAEKNPSSTNIGGPRAIVPDPSGTSVAKTDYEMKNSGNRNEIPRSGVKEMPGSAESASPSGRLNAVFPWGFFDNRFN
jgi:hypothetical protein